MTYAEFWPQYLRAHAQPATRWVHFAGSLAAVACIAVAAATLSGWWLLAAPLVGYGAAWAAHLSIEGNRPQTFGHPVWSLVSDYRMLALWLAGRLAPHLRAAQAGDVQPVAASGGSTRSQGQRLR